MPAFIFDRMARVWVLTLGLLLASHTSAWAHKASDSYLEFLSATSAVFHENRKDNDQLDIKFSIALRDLDAGIDALDADNDRGLTWGELRQNIPVIQAWVAGGLRVYCRHDSLDLAWAFDSLEQRQDGIYARLRSTAVCAQSSDLSVNYQLMKNVDSTHRLLVGGMLQGKPFAAVVSPQLQRNVMLREASNANAVDTPQSTWSTMALFFGEGVHHIATGYDHLAFLLSLLLPIVLVKRYQSTAQRVSAHPGLPALVRTVTGFTLGHSFTLILATIGWIGSPSWVEPAIAISIGISAWFNLYPQRWVRSDALALGFGLIHGLGFSGVMQEANVSTDLLPWALAGFNLGVEAGQMVGIVLWFVLQLLWVRSKWYERVVVRGGSWALLMLAGFWAVERTVNS